MFINPFSRVVGELAIISEDGWSLRFGSFLRLSTASSTLGKPLIDTLCLSALSMTSNAQQASI